MPIATARVIGRRPPRKRLWTSREAFFTDLGIFLLGVAGAFSVNLVGSLPGSEILLFPLLPVLLLAKGSRAFKREYLWFYVLTLAWLLGTIVADLYVGIGLPFRMKGIARVVFFGLDFMVLAILINNKTRRMIIFALSIAAVMLVFVEELPGRLPDGVEIWTLLSRNRPFLAGLLILLRQEKISELHNYLSGSGRIESQVCISVPNGRGSCGGGSDDTNL